MDIRVTIFCLGLALVCGVGFSADTPRDRIIVGFLAGTPDAEFDRIVERFQLVQIREIKNLNARVYTVESQKTETVLRDLAAEKWVEYAERDGQVSILPNSPSTPKPPSE